MLNFLKCIIDQEAREVARFSKKDLTIDTCEVIDGEKPFETAISHPDYNNGRWIIVEAYYHKDAAKIGHAAWVKIMTHDELPGSLSDCQNCGISKLIPSAKLIFKRKK